MGLSVWVFRRFVKVWQLREQFCSVDVFILLPPNESGVCDTDPWLQEIKGCRERVVGKEDLVVMEGAKGRAWRKAGQLGLAADGGGLHILCAPVLQRALRFSLLQGQSGTVGCPSAIRAGV